VREKLVQVEKSLSTVLAAQMFNFGRIRSVDCGDLNAGGLAGSAGMRL
jgi:hypothetical protein